MYRRVSTERGNRVTHNPLMGVILDKLPDRHQNNMALEQTVGSTVCPYVSIYLADRSSAQR
jgi:hypothetical protein